jgi:hypothetical protein
MLDAVGLVIAGLMTDDPRPILNLSKIKIRRRIIKPKRQKEKDRRGRSGHIKNEQRARAGKVNRASIGNRDTTIRLDYLYSTLLLVQHICIHGNSDNGSSLLVSTVSLQEKVGYVNYEPPNRPS